MPKFLNNASLVTQSVPSTPTAGGVLYTSGSSIFFKNSSGTEYSLTGSKGYILVTEYLSGISNWTTPSDAKYVKIVAIAGGGGGGGGGRQPINTAVAGGTGAQGGDTSIVFYPIASIPPGTYTVNVGSGGNGGAGRQTTAGSGTSGTTGGNTSLVSSSVTLIFAAGGGGGTGGTTGTFIGGPQRGNTSGVLNFLPFRMIGNEGGRVFNYAGMVPSYMGSSVLNPNGDYHARNGFRSTGGGGGGSGFNTTTAFNGASGSGIWRENSILLLSGSPGVAGSSPANSGSNGVNNAVTAASLFSFSGSAVVTSSYGFGGGGHGAGAGDTAGTIPGGRGGNGGYFGAGAGGGGAGWNQNGGSGGNGGGGYLAILEYY